MQHEQDFDIQKARRARDIFNQALKQDKPFSSHSRLKFSLYQPSRTPWSSGFGDPIYESWLLELRQWGLARGGSVHQHVLDSLDAYLKAHPEVKFSVVGTTIQLQAWVLGVDWHARLVQVIFDGVSHNGDIRLLIVTAG